MTTEDTSQARPGGPAVPLAGGGAMPLLGFGTWQMTGRTAYEAVLAALRTGYRHIDTATLYRNEREVGRALRDSGVPREEVFITTKLHPRDAGREQRVIAASLEALGTDHVDLWLIHWPPRGRTAAVDTWKALLAVRDEGRTRHAGVSNFGVDLIDEVTRVSGEAPAVNQIRWSPFLHDPGVLAAHRERGVVLEGYSPLATSDLRDPVLAGVAERHGVTPAQVVLRWHIDRGIVVIPKSARPERVAANFEVLGFTLDEDELANIDALGSGGGRRGR